MVSMCIRASAKDIMKNAQTIAMEIHGLLPKACVAPEKTEGYEGFYHMTEFNGKCGTGSDALSSSVTLIRSHLWKNRRNSDAGGYCTDQRKPTARKPRK